MDSGFVDGVYIYWSSRVVPPGFITCRPKCLFRENGFFRIDAKSAVAHWSGGLGLGMRDLAAVSTDSGNEWPAIQRGFGVGNR